MTDREIVNGLINRDNEITEEFFFHDCQPLFRNIIALVFNYEVDYNELVNELYTYLMDNDGAKLRSFQYRCSLYQWLKILSIRFFIKKRNNFIEDNSKEDGTSRELQEANEYPSYASIDIDSLLGKMQNTRYATIIRKLVIEDQDPELTAKEMNITTANLYNIKKRAIAALTKLLINDIKKYGKQ